MQINEQAVLGRAFDSAQWGLSSAQARLDNAAANVAGDSLSEGQADYSRYLADDMLELSRASIETQTNSATYRAASDVFDELLNVGQRIDVRI